MTTTSDPIDFNRAMELLETLGTSHPDHRNPSGGYGSCYYTDPNDPAQHCLVGQIIIELGGNLPPVDDEYLNSNTSAEYLLTNDEWDTGLAFTTEAVALLQTAQFQADQMLPWGTVLDRVKSFQAKGTFT